MKPGGVARFFSTAFLGLAAALALRGIAGLTLFGGDEVEYFDSRFYFFLWGFVLLVLGQLLRLHFRRHAMGAVAVVGLLLVLWKRSTLQAQVNPDAQLFGELTVMCTVLLCLALADRYLQRVTELIVVGPCRALRHKWRKAVE